MYLKILHFSEEESKEGEIIVKEILTFRVYFTFDRLQPLILQIMETNVGSIDRIIRIVIGLGIAIGGIIFESYWGLIGVVILATGVFRFCFVYKILGIDTCKTAY